MTDRGDPFPASRYTPLDPYSPQRRTALVLTGTGADGAYHAGVLRALQEAGVKIDIVGARGVGVIGALFAAIDGAQRLWEEKGFWRAGWTSSLYRWRRIPRVGSTSVDDTGDGRALPGRHCRATGCARFGDRPHLVGRG